jgi:hypothetical protein
LSALTDLQAVAAQIETDIATAVELLTGATNADDPEVEAVATSLTAADQSLQAAITAAATTTPPSGTTPAAGESLPTSGTQPAPSTS